MSDVRNERKVVEPSWCVRCEKETPHDVLKYNMVRNPGLRDQKIVPISTAMNCRECGF